MYPLLAKSELPLVLQKSPSPEKQALPHNPVMFSVFFSVLNAGALELHLNLRLVLFLWTGAASLAAAADSPLLSPAKCVLSTNVRTGTP